ncbi:unnamed protein product [Calicophoron daubneyi]|uniref:Peptidase M14 domain-containing protein n=1 Tax=Calicophoron daubneyi TaxID=300641 RepID=A0AAV2TCT0_CALDB
MHCKLRLVDRDMSKNNCNTLCAHMASSKPIWGDSVCPINPLTEGYEEKYFKSLSKKSKDVFRSNQIYYALMRTGDLHAKLSEPKPLLTLGLGALAPKAIRWPLGTQVLQEKMKHTSPPPQKKEPLYISTGMELQPPAVGPSGGTVVYAYEPRLGNYFEASKINGSIAKTSKPEASHTEHLKFESRFESGNLMKAIHVGKDQYELYLQPDLYTNKYTQWFYFRVSNTRSDRVYRFTVVNFYKGTSLFSEGMRPLMYSEKTASASDIGWHRVGGDIQYYRTKWKNPDTKSSRAQPNRTSATKTNEGDQAKLNSASVGDDQNLDVKEDGKLFYSLTWTMKFQYSDDVVYFSGCYPYTYTQLQEYLANIEANPRLRRVCRQKTLCQTLAGNDVPLLTITEPSDGQLFVSEDCSNDSEAAASDDHVPKSAGKKRCVVITARVHPGETQSSWLVKGIVDYLISEDPDAELLRTNFVFKLVPMLNPDGVIVGNYRCSLSGCDLNRKYTSDLKRFFPTVWHTKEMVLDLMQDCEILIYCDIHGHSRKQQMFVYGCKSTKPDTHYLDRVFPAMLGKNAPDLFDYNKCRFVVQKEREGTGRVVMWRKGIANSYTLEATFCGNTGGSKGPGYHFNSNDYEQMGRQFCDTLLDYCDPDPLKIEFILTELRNEGRARKLAQKNLSDDDDLLDSGTSPEDSSDTGSDSSDDDDLPAYYNYLLHKAGSNSKEHDTRCIACQKEAREKEKRTVGKSQPDIDSRVKNRFAQGATPIPPHDLSSNGAKSPTSLQSVEQSQKKRSPNRSKSVQNDGSRPLNDSTSDLEKNRQKSISPDEKIQSPLESASNQRPGHHSSLCDLKTSRVGTCSQDTPSSTLSSRSSSVPSGPVPNDPPVLNSTPISQPLVAPIVAIKEAWNKDSNIPTKLDHRQVSDRTHGYLLDVPTAGSSDYPTIGKSAGTSVGQYAAECRTDQCQMSQSSADVFLSCPKGSSSTYRIKNCPERRTRRDTFSLTDWPQPKELEDFNLTGRLLIRPFITTPVFTFPKEGKTIPGKNHTANSARNSSRASENSFGRGRSQTRVRLHAQHMFC